MGRLTISNTATLWSPADHSGTLYKRVGGCRPGWRKRFFVLKGSALFYFNDAESFSPRGVIPVELASVSAGQRVQGMLDRRDKYIISIEVHSSFECSKAVYLLSARSTHSQMRWIEALQAVTTPVADLAARASQLDADMLSDVQGTVDSLSGSDDGHAYGKDGQTDKGGASQSGSDNEAGSEVSLSPRIEATRKSGGLSKRLNKDVSSSKKGIRFAEKADEATAEGKATKKANKPFANIKDSVYISGHAFDYHGTPLEDEDVYSLAEQDSDASGWAQQVEPRADGRANPYSGAENTSLDWSSNKGHGYSPDERPQATIAPQPPASHGPPPALSPQQRAQQLWQQHGQQMWHQHGQQQVLHHNQQQMQQMQQEQVQQQMQQQMSMYTSTGAPASPQQSLPSSPSREPAPPMPDFRPASAGQVPQQDHRSAPAASMAPIDWSNSGVFRPSTFFSPQQEPSQQLAPPPPPAPAPAPAPARTPPNAAHKPHHRASSSLQLEPIPEGPDAAATRNTPTDWGVYGSEFTSQSFAAHRASQPALASAYDADHQASPHASRGPSPEPPGSATAAGRPTESSPPGHAYGGPAAGVGRAQSLVAADWSSGGIPRAGSYAAAPPPRLGSITEAGVNGGPQRAPSPGPSGMPGLQPPMNGQASGGQMAGGMPYVGDLVGAGSGGFSRSAAQSMPPSQWTRASVAPGGGVAGYSGGNMARSGAAASMFVSGPTRSASPGPLDFSQFQPFQSQSPSPPASPPPGAGTPNGGQHAAAGPTPLQAEATAWPQLAPASPPPPAEAAADEATPEQRRESGSSINEITRSLEHLRSTVASMQESLRRSPEEGSRSASPEQSRAADALARARHVLRTVESRRSPARGGHSRTSTLDNADLSPPSSPRPGEGGLSRMATMDVPPSAYFREGFGASLASEAPPADAPQGAGRLQRPDGGMEGSLAAGFADAATAKRASAAAGGVALGAGTIGAHRGSHGAQAGGFLPGPPQPRGM